MFWSPHLHQKYQISFQLSPLPFSPDLWTPWVSKAVCFYKTVGLSASRHSSFHVPIEHCEVQRHVCWWLWVVLANYYKSASKETAQSRTHQGFFFSSQQYQQKILWDFLNGHHYDRWKCYLIVALIMNKPEPFFICLLICISSLWDICWRARIFIKIWTVLLAQRDGVKALSPFKPSSFTGNVWSFSLRRCSTGTKYIQFNYVKVSGWTLKGI